jgi:hypothetical protein
LIKVTEFERRQLTAARKEPEAEIDLKTKPSKEAAFQRFSDLSLHCKSYQCAAAKPLNAPT